MPTRRIFAMTTLVAVLVPGPVMGLARLWVRKALGATEPGSVLHGIAEAATIPTAVG